MNAEDTEGLAEAMARVLCDPILRARLAELGRKQAARFTWSEAARRLLEAYRLTAN